MAYMERRAYISDSGTQFLTRISPEIATATASGGTDAFGWNVGAPNTLSRVPQGLRMRTIDLVSSTSGKRRRVAVGNVDDAALWADPSQNVTLQTQAGGSELYIVTGRSGERRTFS